MNKKYFLKISVLLILVNFMAVCSLSARMVRNIEDLTQFIPLDKLNPDDTINKLEQITESLERYRISEAILERLKCLIGEIREIDSTLSLSMLCLGRFPKLVDELELEAMYHPSEYKVIKIINGLEEEYNYFSFIYRLKNGEINPSDVLRVKIWDSRISFRGSPVYFHIENESLQEREIAIIVKEEEIKIAVINEFAEPEIVTAYPLEKFLKLLENPNQYYQFREEIGSDIYLERGFILPETSILVVFPQETIEFWKEEGIRGFVKTIKDAEKILKNLNPISYKQILLTTNELKIAAGEDILPLFGGEAKEHGIIRLPTSFGDYSQAEIIWHENAHFWFGEIDKITPIIKKNVKIEVTRFFNYVGRAQTTAFNMMNELFSHLHSIMFYMVVYEECLRKGIEDENLLNWLRGGLSDVVFEDYLYVVSLVETELIPEDCLTEQGLSLFENIKMEIDRLIQNAKRYETIPEDFEGISP